MPITDHTIKCAADGNHNAQLNCNLAIRNQLISMLCVPGRKAGRKQAFELSSGLCASAAPDASAFPFPAPGGAEWPAVFASPGTPVVQKQELVSTIMHSASTSALSVEDLIHHLFLLPHYLQFLCQLDLPLPLCFFCSTAQLLSVFIS